MLSLLLAAVLTAPVEVQVQTLAGQTVAGQLTALADDTLKLATAGGEQSFATKDLLSVSLPSSGPAAATTGAWVTLADGSLLVARSFSAKDDQAQIALLGSGALSVPTRALDTVRYREHTGALAEQWAEIGKADRSSDLLVVRKNDSLDFLTGVIREADDALVSFEVDGDVVPVKRSKVDGLFYHRAAKPAKSTSACVISDAHGSRIRAAALSLVGDELRLRTPGGVEIAAPLSSFTRFDFSQGNVQYLADLKPESSVWTPYFGDSPGSTSVREFYRPRVDQALDGGALRLGGKEYKKGMAVHSRTELSYRLPEEYRTFQAVVGIDDRARPGGDVQLTIHGDDRTLFEGRISGRDAPRPLDLDVAGVNRLRITVDYGEGLDLADHLDLCEARILK